ncbi:DUF1648 domain-containing protein [Streptomyces sp. BE303]|uniref:DUF1648 domain-containing protein n=1 Tax=Streptomyces sp. BE303 TaxID=3002528 RepID=UPI002E7650A8|nr:DUF1648 domain-containing protein [Streptomyces sp. BE303]MED7947463.1 DUF1648 domain-containing protein [Streptomyces sp. BE303]
MSDGVNGDRQGAGAGTGGTGSTDTAKRASRAAAALWAATVAVLLLALPWVAHGRLPDPLATHWDGRAADGSMSLTASAAFPAACWAVALAAAAVARRWAGAPARTWVGAGLGFGGVLLVGAQAAIVHANLDRPDWQHARPLGPEVAAVLAAAVAAGLLGPWLAHRGGRGPRPATAADGPRLDLPAGQRAVWLSRTVNPWLGLLAAASGLGAAGSALAALGGLGGPAWALFAPCAVVAVTAAGCSSVQARVTERGLDVTFGPFGWPARHWSPADVAAARMERRTPAQVGGWGYRLSGLGTTVMLRRGECLVVRPHRGVEFAVSVDDAERGAALLNTVAARRAG